MKPTVKSAQVKNLSDAFPIQNGLKQGDTLWLLLFNCSLEYINTKVKRKEGLELNETHQLLVYPDDVNIRGENINTIKKKSRALLEVSWENGQEVNTDKTKYMVLSGH
jgi:hypothetical protein